jgi:hypothetical protein
VLERLLKLHEVDLKIGLVFALIFVVLGALGLIATWMLYRRHHAIKSGIHPRSKWRNIPSGYEAIGDEARKIAFHRYPHVPPEADEIRSLQELLEKREKNPTGWHGKFQNEDAGRIYELAGVPMPADLANNIRVPLCDRTTWSIDNKECIVLLKKALERHSGQMAA